MKTAIQISSTLLLLLTMSGHILAATLNANDLVKRDGLFFERFTDVPFTGTVEGSEQGSLTNGLRHGPWVFFDDNGHLLSRGNFKNGYENGSWEFYSKNGQLIKKGKFVDGEREGLWIGYWENGNLEFKGHFQNGKKNGHWEYFDRRGEILDKFTGSYKDGLKVGQPKVHLRHLFE
jgi:hypothetical protein